MIPISAQAKFITIMANLLEVFFLVIFFNVILVSIRPIERSIYMGPYAGGRTEDAKSHKA
jgi:hypothetical protein